MEELKKWLEANKIAYRQIDNEVVEVTVYYSGRICPS